MRGLMWNLTKFLGLAAVLLAAWSVSAQEITGSIRGTVTDPSGATVQGASVSARQLETGLTRKAITESNGEYILLELPIGNYRIQVEAKNFRQYAQEGITLHVNETA